MADVLTLFDEIPGTFLVTDKNGLLRYANQAVAQKTGFDVAQAIGQKAGQLWGKHMPRAFYGQLWETVREKEKPFIAEGINKTRLGAEMKEKWYIAPISDGQDPLYLQIGLPFRADQRFDDAFATQLGHKRVSGDTLLWLYQHLGGKKNTPFFSDTTLASTIQQLFLAPMEGKFLARVEDKILIEDAQKDQKQFARLFTKYFADIFSYFRFHTSDPALADELTQEVFLRAYEYLENFTYQNASYRTYLRRIAHNILVSYYRRDAKREPMVSLEIADATDLYYTSCPLDIAPQQTINFGKLSEMERAVIEAFYEEEMSVRDIAVLYQTTENAVKLSLSRARKKLRE